MSTDIGDNVSTMTRKLGDRPRINSKGKLHCFHCRAADHWAYKCPELTGEQQGQLKMNVEAQDMEEKPKKKGNNSSMWH